LAKAKATVRQTFWWTSEEEQIMGFDPFLINGPSTTSRLQMSNLVWEYLVHIVK
jgi:hypothetical protein